MRVQQMLHDSFFVVVVVVVVAVVEVVEVVEVRGP